MNVTRKDVDPLNAVITVEINQEDVAPKVAQVLNDYQWTATQNTSMPQGLGTGGLFTNNIDSPLVAGKGVLQYNNALSWDTNYIR